MTHLASSLSSAPRALAPAQAALGEPMRAIVQTGYGSSDVLALGTAARPAPQAGEVLVRVHAAGIDRGTWHLMTGRPYLMRLMGFGFFAPKNPVPGLDLAGEVVQVGPGVSRFRVGDAVFGIGQGSFAEYACARESKLAPMPEGWSWEQGAVLAVSGGTAFQALTQTGALQARERVLIIGASGGVGSYAVQLAKALGAEVTGVASTSKLALVRSLGADHVIDYLTSDFAANSLKYDLILDIGGNTPLRRLRRALTPTGRVVFVGGEHGGDWTAGFGRIIGALLLAPFVKQRFAMQVTKEHFSTLEQLTVFARAGQLRPSIDRQITLAAVPGALRDLEAGRVRGKVAVSIIATA